MKKIMEYLVPLICMSTTFFFGRYTVASKLEEYGFKYHCKNQEVFYYDDDKKMFIKSKHYTEQRCFQFEKDLADGK